MKRYLSILLLPLVVSCSDHPSSSNTGAGTLEGSVSLRDQYGNPISDNSGATVSLLGTDFETETDAAGNWKFDSVPTGVYELRTEKQGFGSEQKQVQFVGVGTLMTGTDALYPFGDFTVDSVSITPASMTLFRAKAWITPGTTDPGYTNAYVFFSSTPQPPERPYRYSSMGDLVGRDGTPPFLDGQLHTAQLASDSGWVSGQTIYVTVYPVVGVNTEYDPVAKQDYYSSIDPASGVTVPVTLP